MSEEILRIKIKDTESAGVEIIPTEEGVEIVVTRKPKLVTVSGPHGDVPKKGETAGNLEKLRSFCTAKKEFHKGDKTVLADLRRFWDFYSPKMSEWRGKADCGKLWERWCPTRQGSSAEA